MTTQHDPYAPVQQATPRRIDATQYTGQPSAPVPVYQPQPQAVVPPLTAYPVQPVYAQPAPPPVPQYSQPVAMPAQPAPAAAAPPAVAADENTVTFSRAYRAHDIEVRSIRLRKPVTKEIRKLGNPLKLNVDEKGVVTDVEIKYDVVANYIPVLSTTPLPPSTVDLFEFADLDRCAGVIVGFFAPTAA